MPVPPWLLLLLFLATTGAATTTSTGEQIMGDVLLRQEREPYVYEEQTLVLLDANGQREVRSMRRHARIDADNSFQQLVVFDQPEEIRGTAFLIRRGSGANTQNLLYLPALDHKFQPLSKGGNDSHFLGSDFAMEDLTPEIPADFRYFRQVDQELEKIDYFVVDAFAVNEQVRQTTLYGRRRHYIRQDNLVIARTDYFDWGDHLIKRRTSHDLKQVKEDLWLAGAILMDHIVEHHKSLIKVDRRIFSASYVPPEIFTPEWLAANRHKDLVKPSSMVPISSDGPNSPAP
jgi:hypothetical protein